MSSEKPKKFGNIQSRWSASGPLNIQKLSKLVLMLILSWDICDSESSASRWQPKLWNVFWCLGVEVMDVDGLTAWISIDRQLWSLWMMGKNNNFVKWWQINFFYFKIDSCFSYPNVIILDEKFYFIDLAFRIQCRRRSDMMSWFSATLHMNWSATRSRTKSPVLFM